jgi:hypothetical protein
MDCNPNQKPEPGADPTSGQQREQFIAQGQEKAAELGIFLECT